MKCYKISENKQIDVSENHSIDVRNRRSAKSQKVLISKPQYLME